MSIFDRFHDALEIALDVALTMEHASGNTEAEREAARCRVFAHAVSYSLRDIDPELSRKLRALRCDSVWSQAPSGQ